MMKDSGYRVQLGPDTGDYGWDHCAGYHHEDKEILGFSHTHLSGTLGYTQIDLRPYCNAQQSTA
jgi:putative alpha-1,2-mannosidase